MPAADPAAARDGPPWPRLGRLDCALEPLDGAGELEWLDAALAGRARAVLWRAPRGLVVPLSYRRHAAFDAACASSAAAGWPVRLRRSGGGLVPQGPGVLNLSLALPIDDGPGPHFEAVYRGLCRLLAAALAGLGIYARPGGVDGSFCDGRFNLAVAGDDGAPRKIAGTAQYWRHAGGRHAVLAHAVLLVDADPSELTARANAFEAALDTGRRYRDDVLTTLAREWCRAQRADRAPADLDDRLRRQLAAALGAA